MIYFVRHGQTDDNVNSILTGWLSTPLNEKGLEQAKQTAKELKDIHFDVCFCSPLLRTQQTLDEVLKYHKNLPVVLDDRLKERNYGELTGKHTSEWVGERWNSNSPVLGNMETIYEMYNRVEVFMIMF